MAEVDAARHLGLPAAFTEDVRCREKVMGGRWSSKARRSFTRVTTSCSSPDTSRGGGGELRL
ncbi:hypothetical protein [Methanoculleus chikugoensis]|uniref:hypothetical protein n=1 Tax=Methanoculleus chikugoensis TaxID=118126 RepID=UPI001FB3C6E7|nr:hypothetical protein [Methanoculleus chikugoensis]